MTTTINLRKLLHRKAWEFCTPSPSNTAAGAFFLGDKSGLLPADDANYLINGTSSIWNYNAEQDAWIQVPSSGIAGTFGSGSCGEFRALGAPGGTIQNTATGGSTTTIITNRTIVRDIRGCKIRIVGGSGAGYEGKIESNTIGANAVITVTPAASVAFDATTVYQIWSGSVWFFNAGSGAVGFAVYDRATNAWTQKSVTGLPTSWGTTGQLVSTGSAEGAFETGTSTGSNTTTTLINSAKSWPTNAYANAQVRIVSGTGAGQVRTVASNTATTLTVSAAWTVTPDATSVYSIEGNDDYMYLLGNNSANMYRYTISTNTWVTITPVAARGGVVGGGGTADWINSVADPDWQGAQGKPLMQTGALVKQNGRYIYSFRGAGSSALDVYDISANTWIANTYGGQMETFNTGSCSVDWNGNIYIQKEGTGRIFRFNVEKNYIEAFATNAYPQSTTVDGDKLVVLPYIDGATTVPFLYVIQHSRTELLRMIVIG